MRLYLNAESKKCFGYTPDWLKVSYEDNGKEFELTLDIQGDIDYSRNGLRCRCKGDLVPWVLYDYENGSEIDLSRLPVEEVDELFPISKIIELFRTGTNFRVGVYPVEDGEIDLALAEDDTFSKGDGLCEIYDGENEYVKNFEFEVELNIY